MATVIDGRSRELLEKPNFCFVGTTRSDGTAHVVPVWVDVDGDRVVLNTAEGRVWPNNAQRDPRVTLTVQNLEDPYEYVQIRGRVVDWVRDGADDHIDAMSKKYLDEDDYPYRKEDETRVKVLVEPEKVFHYGA